MTHRMNTREEINNELKSLGLRTLSAHKPFGQERVPDDFFDTLPGQIMQKIASEPAAMGKPGFISFSMRRTLAYAASLLLLIGVGMGYWLMENRSEMRAQEDVFLENYFLNIADTDRGMFYDIIHSNGVSGDPQAVFPDDSYSEYLMEYLLDVAQFQGIDPEEFMDQTVIHNQP